MASPLIFPFLSRTTESPPTEAPCHFLPTPKRSSLLHFACSRVEVGGPPTLWFPHEKNQSYDEERPLTFNTSRHTSSQPEGASSVSGYRTETLAVTVSCWCGRGQKASPVFSCFPQGTWAPGGKITCSRSDSRLETGLRALPKELGRHFKWLDTSPFAISRMQEQRLSDLPWLPRKFRQGWP